MWGVLAEVFRGVAGSSWGETYSGNHAAWPSESGGLTQLHAIAKESVACIYYPEHSHRRTHCAGIQQREAPAAGRAFMDEHQFEVEGAERPYVRPRSYWEAQRTSQHLVIWQGYSTQPQRSIWREKVPGRILMQLLGIGSNVVVGWRSTRDMLNLTPLTSRSYWRHFTTKKMLHSLKSISFWRIVRKVAGTRRHVARIKPSDNAWSRMSGICLSTWWQILTWLTLMTGHMEKYIEVEENLWGAERGARFTCFT